MFQTLLASAPQAPPSLTRLLASVGVHGLTLLAALALTATHPSVTTRPREAAIPLMLPPVHRNEQRPAPPSPSRLPAPVPLLPVIDPPPLLLPEIRPSGPTVADLLASASQAGGPPAVAGTSPIGVMVGASAEFREELEVDDPVQIVEQPPVRFPPALAHAGVAGQVELEYVVDTLGRVEPRSVRAVATTRPEFEAAARGAVLASRFRPARWHGQVVRQLVRQSFRFRLAPDRSSARDE
jgi:TonB family protein